jgi:hypothetical protein
VRSIQIGQLLIQQGVLTDAQVRHILAIQKASYRPFGDLAERLYGISSEAVEDAWVQQYVRESGIASLDELDVDIDCLRTINRRQAWQFHVLPTNREGGLLNIATDAGHLVRSLNFATNRIDEPVGFIIAEREQLRDFLMRHYPVPQQMADFAERF